MATTVSSSDASSTVSSSSTSTRDQLLRRLNLAKSTVAANASTAAGGAGGAEGKNIMECFETPDVDEAASTAAPSVRSLLSSVNVGSKKGVAHSEDVDSSALRPKVAFQRFAGSLLGSPTPSANGVASVYESGGADLLVPKGEQALKFESPFARLQRLSAEIAEFDSELRQATQGVKSSSSGTATASGEAEVLENLAASVAQLQAHLDTLATQNQLTNDAASVDAPATSFDSLFAQYVAALSVDPTFQLPQPATAAEKSAASNSSNPSSSELAQLPRLEQRLAQLEKFIGGSGVAGTATANKQSVPNLLAFGSNPAAASADKNAATSNASAATLSVLPAPDIISAIQSIHSQLQALNPSRLDSLTRSIKQLLLENESALLVNKDAAATSAAAAAGAAASSSADPALAAATAAAPSASVNAAQIQHLYALTSRWDVVALGLPQLLARLSSLHALHSASASFALRLSSLESQSEQIDTTLKQQAEAALAVQKSAKENAQQMKENFNNMEERIRLLNEKIQQLTK